MKGIINLYKPKGISSAFAVQKVKRILRQKDVGHMGTLDPDAEGVLLIGVGKATRLFDFFLKKDKVYDAEFTFGYETDTLDGSGAVVKTAEKIPTAREIESVLKNQIGEINQLPPKYSSKNINGRRAYDLARAGEDFELKPNKVEIYSIELLQDCGDGKYRFSIHCSAGTYIRSICRDLAHDCGSLATMTALKRVRCGVFEIKDSVTLDMLEKIGAESVLPVEKVLSDCDSLVLDDKMYGQLINGIKLPCDKEGVFTVYCRNELFGLGQSVDNVLKIKSYLRD